MAVWLVTAARLPTPSCGKPYAIAIRRIQRRYLVIESEMVAKVCSFSEMMGSSTTLQAPYQAHEKYLAVEIVNRLVDAS
jgi:hypothetical protein